MIVPAASFGLAWLLLAVVWWYVVSGPIRTGGDLDPGIASYHFFRNLAIPTLFFLSIGISFISVAAAVACWFSAVRHGHRDVALAAPTSGIMKWLHSNLSNSYSRHFGE